MKSIQSFSHAAACLALGLLISSNGAAQTAEIKKPEGKTVEINADRMRSENGGQKIVFSGSVSGIWGDLKITSDVLEVYNTQDKKNTDEIVAIGNVNITRGETRARGDRAVYLDQQQQIILTGSPKAVAWEGKDMIEGKEMIFLLDKDRFVVNDRVRMMLYPKEKKEPKEKPGKKKAE